MGLARSLRKSCTIDLEGDLARRVEQRAAQSELTMSSARSDRLRGRRTTIAEQR
jgi:hypothetical protein